MNLEVRNLAAALLAGVAALTLGGAPGEAAILTLEDLSAPGSKVTIADGSAADSSAEAGVVTFIGAVGAFNVNVTTGVTKPVLPSSLPRVDLNSVNVSTNSVSPAGLLLSFTETDFLLSPLDPGDPFQLGSIFSVGGTTEGSLFSARGFVDATNAAFGTQQQIGGFDYARPPEVLQAFSDQQSGSVNLLSGNPFSMTVNALIRHDDPGDITSFNIEATVIPLPAALPLSLAGVAALGALGALRRKRA